MDDSRNPNIQMLELAVEFLGELTERLVFVGGCTVGILISDDTAPTIRVTQDVDVIADVDLKGYYSLQECLRSRGFYEDQREEAPICRWRKGNLTLDVMPTDPNVLGFGSEWFKIALDTAQLVSLPSGKQISMIATSSFIACKFSAFESRGEEDYLLSQDIEDVVALLDGRTEIVEEIISSDKKLKGYLIGCFDRLLKDDRFLEALPGIMPGDKASQARVPIIISRIETILKQSEEKK
ncbi:hypothetical protein KJ966_07860 [bacterium]|nr:hypothetical protein [bacterium]